MFSSILYQNIGEMNFDDFKKLSTLKKLFFYSKVFHHIHDETQENAQLHNHKFYILNRVDIFIKEI